MRKISDLLREAREEKKLTLEEIERETKIKKEFIDAIEKGKFQDLPSESYAMGFVKNYAKFLGIPVSSAIPLFRREYKSKHQIHIVPEFRNKQYNRKFFFTSKSFLFFIIIFLVSVYIFFQYSSLIFAPKLEIISPKNNEVLSESVVDVKGKTDPYATVYVSGDEAYVNLQGNFRKSVYVFSGENKIDIRAVNRFGKETKKEITIKIK